MANLEEILKNIDNIKPEDLYSVLQKLGYDGDANELKQEIEKLFDEEELEFVSGGQNELSRRVGAGILGLLPIMTSITSDAFANDLNSSVTIPVSKNINKNNSKKINWQDIKNKGKQFAKEMNLPDKKTVGALSVTSLVMLALGYGLKSLTTPSKTVELSPEKMNKVQGLAKSSAEEDFENKNFKAWKSGLKDLLINWFFDEESNKNEIDLSVVVKTNISMQLIRSETWLDNIYINFNSQEMPLRDYIEQAVKNKKYRYSPDLLVYLLGVYNNTYIQSYNFVKLEDKKHKATKLVKEHVEKEEELKTENSRLSAENTKLIKIEQRENYLCTREQFFQQVYDLTARALETAKNYNRPEDILAGVLAESITNILKEIHYETGAFYCSWYGTAKICNEFPTEPITLEQMNLLCKFDSSRYGYAEIGFNDALQIWNSDGLPYTTDDILRACRLCQRLILSSSFYFDKRAEKTNGEIQHLQSKIQNLETDLQLTINESEALKRERAKLIDANRHSRAIYDNRKKQKKKKMIECPTKESIDVNEQVKDLADRRKKEYKTKKTFERFMRKVARKERQNFGEQTYVEISELINCIDDPETKKLFSDKRSDFKNKRKIKSNTKTYDYNDIYLGELPENENYLDIDGSGNTNQNYKHELEELSSDNEDYSVSEDEDTQHSESNEEVAVYDSSEYDEHSQYCVQSSDSDDDDSTNNSDWFDSPEERDYSEKDESENEPQENNQNSVTEEYTDDIHNETSFNMLNDSGEDLNDEN